MGQYEQSGKTFEAFAQEKGLNVWTLRGWVNRSRAQKTTSPPPVREVDIDWSGVPPQRSSDWVAELEWPSGLVMRWKQEFDLKQAKELVATLKKVC